jgi:hypothetical protein
MGGANPTWGMSHCTTNFVGLFCTHALYQMISTFTFAGLTLPHVKDRRAWMTGLGSIHGVGRDAA